MRAPFDDIPIDNLTGEFPGELGNDVKCYDTEDEDNGQNKNNNGIDL